MKKVKVILYTDRWTTGGIEKYIAGLAGGLDTKLFQPLVLTAQKEAELYDAELEQHGIRVQSLLPDICEDPIERIRNTWKLFYEYIRMEKPDILHLHICQGVGFVYSFLAKKAGVGIVVAHSHNSNCGSRHRLVKLTGHLLCRALFQRNVDIKLACSDLAGEWLYGKPGAFKVVKVPIDLERFRFDEGGRAQMRRRYGIQGECVILNIGRLGEQKNQLFLLELFEEFQKGRQAKLFIIGQGELESEIRQEIHRRSLEESVVIIGHTSEVEKYLWMSDVFVLPSLYEGNPVVLAEAQASGLSCVYSDSITDMARINENTASVPLRADRRVWIGKIAEAADRREARFDAWKNAENSGYGAQRSVKEIQEIYLKAAALPILSACDVINYGTMLQCYALHRTLVNMGYEAEVVNYPHRELLRQLPRLFHFELVRSKWKSIIKKRLINKDITIRDYNEKKDRAFTSFREECIPLSEELLSRKQLKKYAGTKKAVILGSDQVWNPVNLGRDFYTMSFVPKEVRKVAYAPSFGVCSIPTGQRRRTKKYLKRIEFLSVREKSGAEIIRELTGREARVVCDPTLLLSSAQWRQEERRVEGLPESYIFCYFLGNSGHNRSFANKLKQLTGLRIVHLPYMDEFVEEDGDFGDMIPQGAGPREFLYLIHHADYVCTDSFHGTVFSLQFHRNFYSMPRTGKERSASTSSRLTDLLSWVRLSGRYLSAPGECDVERLLKTCGSIEWSEVDGRIRAEREAATAYLAGALEEGGIENDY